MSDLNPLCAMTGLPMGLGAPVVLQLLVPRTTDHPGFVYGYQSANRIAHYQPFLLPVFGYISDTTGDVALRRHCPLMKDSGFGVALGRGMDLFDAEHMPRNLSEIPVTALNGTLPLSYMLFKFECISEFCLQQSDVVSKLLADFMAEWTLRRQVGASADQCYVEMEALQTLRCHYSHQLIISRVLRGYAPPQSLIAALAVDILLKRTGKRYMPSGTMDINYSIETVNAVADITRRYGQQESTPLIEK